MRKFEIEMKIILNAKVIIYLKLNRIGRLFPFSTGSNMQFGFQLNWHQN